MVGRSLDSDYKLTDQELESDPRNTTAVRLRYDLLSFSQLQSQTYTQGNVVLPHEKPKCVQETQRGSQRLIQYIGGLRAA